MRATPGTRTRTEPSANEAATLAAALPCSCTRNSGPAERLAFVLYDMHAATSLAA
jgi:hypothetical protein